MAIRNIRALMLAASIPLAGCVSHWERGPVAAQRDWNIDRASCALAARGMPQQGFMFAGGGTGRAGAYAAGAAGLASAAMIIAQAAQAQEDRDNCMQSVGWQKIAGPAPK